MTDFGKLPAQKPSKQISFESFAGSQACLSCHPEQGSAWTASGHGQAGGLPNESTILPSFDNVTLPFTDAKIILRNQAGKYAFEVHIGNLPVLTYSVDGVVGRGLIYGGGAQTYFHRRTDGLMVFIPIEFNTTKNVWFCQTSGPKKWAAIDGSISLSECGWPPDRSIGATPGASCQNCHGSQIDVNYVGQKRGYETRFVELNINCESCHGPGKKHISLMQLPASKRGDDIGMTPLETLSKTESVDICLACHANKPHIGTGYLSGKPFHEHFAALTLWDPQERKTHFDGRVVNFGYQQGHLYSDCYVNGSMTCVDCHDPHSLKYRDIHGKALKGRFSNGQCTGCHAAKEGAYSARHSRHDADSPGNQCTSCHMAYKQMDEVGDLMKHERSDHVIPIPRPAFDVALGAANGCEPCHKKDGVAWQAKSVETLFGDVKPHRPLVAQLFEFTRKFGPGARPTGQTAALKAAEALVAHIQPNSSIAGIYAISILVGELLMLNIEKLSPATIGGLWRATRADSVDLRAAAAAAIMVLAPETSQLRYTLFEALANMEDQLTAMKRKIVYNLIGIDHAYSSLNRAARRRVRAAMLRDGLVLNEQHHELLPAIGASYASENNSTAALTYYKRGADDAHYAQSRYAVGIIGARHDVLELIAMTQRELGDAKAAQQTMREILELNPYDNKTRNQICRALAEQGRFLETVECLDEAIANEPLFVMGYLIKAKFLERIGRYGEALANVKIGLKYIPNNAEAQAHKAQLERRLERK